MKPTTPATLPHFAFRLKASELLNIQGSDESTLGSMNADVEVQGKRQNMTVFFRTSPEKLKELQTKKFANTNQETVGAFQNLLLLRGVPPQKIDTFIKRIAQEAAETARGEEVLRNKHRAADDTQAMAKPEGDRQAARKALPDERKQRISSKSLRAGLMPKQRHAERQPAAPNHPPRPFKDVEALEMNSTIASIFKQAMGDKDDPDHLVVRVDESLKSSKFERTSATQGQKNAASASETAKPAKTSKPLPATPLRPHKPLPPTPSRSAQPAKTMPVPPPSGMPTLPEPPDE